MRLQRVNQLIREEISHLIQRELKDPRLGFVTVTEVDVAKDLRTAKVYVSVLGSETQWQSSLQALESARLWSTAIASQASDAPRSARTAST